MKTIRLSKLLFTNYPKESQNLVEILNKHNISYEILKNTKDIWTRVHISELPDSDAGVVPDTFAMRFSRV